MYALPVLYVIFACRTSLQYHTTSLLTDILCIASFFIAPVHLFEHFSLLQVYHYFTPAFVLGLSYHFTHTGQRAFLVSLFIAPRTSFVSIFVTPRTSFVSLLIMHHSNRVFAPPRVALYQRQVSTAPKMSMSGNYR